MSEETPRVCGTCQKEKANIQCPTRAGCFTPDYVNWEAIGEEEENTGCPTCHHWAAVKIGNFCPDCGQPVLWT